MKAVSIIQALAGLIFLTGLTHLSAQTANAPLVDMSVVGERKFQNANTLFENQKFAEALKAYSEYLVEFPFEDANRETTLFRIAESFRQLGRNADALQGYQSFAGEFPESGLFPLAAVRLGDLLSLEGKYQEALVYYSTAVAQTKDAALKYAAQFASARTLQTLGKTAEAAEKYAEVAREAENNPYATVSALAAANLFAELGQFARAIPFYQLVKRDDSRPALQLEAAIKLGNRLFEEGRWAEASGEYRFARNLPIDSPQWKQFASYQLLQCLARTGDHAGVLRLYETPGETFPPGTEADSLLIAARAARSEGDERAALRYYDRYLKDFADAPNADAVAYDRLFIIASRRSQEIWGIADAFLRKYPQSAYAQNVRYLMAREKLAAKDFKAALKVFDEMVKTPLPNELKADVLYERARLRLQLGDFAGAVTALRLFTEDIPDDPRRPQALFQLALTLQKTGKSEEAIEVFDELLKKYPKAPEREEALAQAALLNGKLEHKKRARELFETLLKEFPQSTRAGEANYWIGWSLAEEGDFAGAIPCFQEARELDDKAYGAKATFRMVLALYAQQKPDALSREIFQYEKYKTPPEIPAAIHGWLAEKFFSLGKHAQAVPFYERLLDAPDASADMKKGGLLQLGRAQIKAGLYEEAVASLERYLKTYSQPEEQVICLLELSSAHRGARDFPQARSSAEKVMELTGEGWANAEARLLLGQAYFDEGKPEEAVKFFKSVALLYYDPQIVPQAMVMLSEAYGRLGKSAERSQTLRELKERFPNFEPGE
ncbi:tetratricopeptide repeat protein [Kamptonema cortianum]|nr:tetratricopeptide repeat protein [Oscillatoria laete-virens]MDK3160221.1 tetratricopeptide repeat protein [Kamptonema cortianum]MDL5048425.1 tetratricopeptide repeat protein [Oscillatoria amoena NRMC-F 0135]MDL5055664.1 tetratricopeptide repeat protein [Oscillatoria laete-virens NRMC-F 0139]